MSKTRKPDHRRWYLVGTPEQQRVWVRNHPEQPAVSISLSSPTDSLAGHVIMPWDTIVYLKGFHEADFYRRQEVNLAISMARAAMYRPEVETVELPDAEFREGDCGCGKS